MPVCGSEPWECELWSCTVVGTIGIDVVGSCEVSGDTATTVVLGNCACVVVGWAVVLGATVVVVLVVEVLLELVVGAAVVVVGGFHETVDETVLDTPATTAVAVYVAEPVEFVLTVIVAMPLAFVVAVNVCPASGPALTVTVTDTPDCGTPEIVCAVAVIVRSSPAFGDAGLIESVNELGNETEPPPIDTAFLVLVGDGYG